MASKHRPHQSASRAGRWLWVALAFALVFGQGAALAQGKGRKHPVSEVFIGFLNHDTGVFGNNKEDGPTVNLEWRLDPLDGVSWWSLILSPQPTIGFNINTEGNTNTLYAAVTWTYDITTNVFFDWSMGGAVHDGKTSANRLDRKDLGSRVLFYLAAGVGYRFFDRHSVSIRLDHMSNASLADDNDGLDTVGLRYGYRF